MPVAKLVEPSLHELVDMGLKMQLSVKQHFQESYFSCANTLLGILNEMPYDKLTEREKQVKKDLEVYMFFKPLEQVLEYMNNNNNEIDVDLLHLLQEYCKSKEEVFDKVVECRFSVTTMFEQVQAHRSSYGWEERYQKTYAIW